MSDVYLRIGDVLIHEGREHVVEMVNDCRARITSIVGKQKTINGKTFNGTPTTYSISNRIERECVLRNDRELAITRVNKQKAKQTRKVESMAKKSIPPAEKPAKSKTAEAPKGDGKQEAPAKPGSLGGIFGHSVTSVLRRLGKEEGVSTARIRAIMAAKGLEVSPTTVSIQVNNGRHGKGEPADLTAAQVKELLAAAPEPEKATKAEK